MFYKNHCIIISNDKDCRINEQFNELLEVDEYFIIDIDKISKDIGEKIIKRYDDRKKDEGYHKIKDLVKFELKQLEKNIIENTENYLDYNW